MATSPTKPRKLIKHNLSLKTGSRSQTRDMEQPKVPAMNIYSFLPAIDLIPDVIADCNAFATAETELLERVHCSQRPVPTPSKVNCRPATSGFVTLDNFEPSPDDFFQTQLPISMTQLDRLCESTEAQPFSNKAPHDATVVFGNISKSAKPSSSDILVPQPLTVREAILNDFDCSSPSSQSFAVSARVIDQTPNTSEQTNSESPKLAFNPNHHIRTYSRQRKPRRQLFTRRCSDASSQSDHVDLISHLDGEKDAVLDTCTTDTRQISSPVDLNLSGSVRKNILSLSQYYSQMSPEAIAGSARPDDNIREVNETFKNIMWSNTCTRPAGDASSGESRSFAGFEESTQNAHLVSSDVNGEEINLDSSDSDDADSINNANNDCIEDDDEEADCSKRHTSTISFKYTNVSGNNISTEKSSSPHEEMFGGFTTGRGASIAVSTTSMARSRSLFAEFDVDPKRHPTDHTNPSAVVGFSTARGGHIEISDAALENTVRLFHDIDVNVSSDRTPSAGPPAFGFTTGRGSHIYVSAASVNRSRKIFEDEMCEATGKDLSPYHTPINKRTAPNLTSTPINGRQQSSTSFKSAGLCLITDSKAAYGHNFTHTDITPIKNVRSTAANNNDLQTPVNSRPIPGSLTQEITASTKALLEDELHSSGMENSLISFGTKDVRESISSLRRTRLSTRFNAISNATNIQPPHNSAAVQFVDELVLSARCLAQHAQDEHIRTKKVAKIQPGALYLKKQKPGRQKWPEFVCYEHPTTNPSSLPAIHYDNASSYSFDMSSEMSSDDTKGLRLEDDIHVHLSAHNRIGLPELRRAFLSSSGVDPRLVTEQWLTHHYALIVHKLAAMEYAFPNQLGAGRTLCVQNMALQLKWRYDMEIDRAQRSILHRICEKDAVPGARMVLFVLRSWSERECDLCDGHYVMRTVLDSELERLWRDGRIRVGTKLMMHGAELVGLDDGCSPLQIPSDVRLRIFANSTRRVRWHTKLGACRIPGPFRIGLDSVLPSGGRIGYLQLHIVRVYAMLYVEKSRKEGSNTVIRSERVYQRDEATSVKHMVDIERIYSQVTHELELSELPAARKSSRLAMTARCNRSISQLNDTSQVYRILENAIDPQAIENQLSISQKRDLCAYQSRKNDVRNELINQRVRERTGLIDGSDGRPKVTPLLRLRVVDARQISVDGCVPKTAILSVWNVHEDLQDMLHEGETVRVSCLSKCDFRNGDLQLSSGRNTQFKRLGSSFYCQRQVIPIANIIRTPSFRPVFNEFDTVGIVVRISDAATRKFQSVYVADPSNMDRPAILCINFWSGLHSFAYEGLVSVGRALAARDLQWREISGQSSIPCLFATEVTALTEHPRQKRLATAMSQLMAAIERLPMAKFIAECEEIIDAATNNRRR